MRRDKRAWWRDEMVFDDSEGDKEGEEEASAAKVERKEEFVKGWNVLNGRRGKGRVNGMGKCV